MTYTYTERLHRANTYQGAVATKMRLMTVPSAVGARIKREGAGYSIYVKYKRLKRKAQRPRHLRR